MDETVALFVRRIPAGMVVSYGDVARAIGLPGRARMVGWSLRRLPANTDVSWHRVVNRNGEISIVNPDHLPSEQRVRLEAEGNAFFEIGGMWRLRNPHWYGRADA